MNGNFFYNQRILLAAAHNDDIEFMFGGTLSKLVDNQEELGCEFMVITFASREENTGEPFEKVLSEQATSFSILGLEPLHIENHKFRSRFLPDFEDEIRLGLKSVKDQYHPDIVMTHYSGDRNQDHQAVHEQVIRVFPDKTVVGGEVTNTGDKLKPNFFIGLERGHIEKKHQAVNAYKAEAHKSYFDYGLIEALARVRGGHSARYGFAEAFELYRLHS